MIFEFEYIFPFLIWPQLLSLIQTPATSLVRLLGTPGTQLAQVLEAHREKQEKA